MFNQGCFDSLGHWVFAFTELTATICLSDLQTIAFPVCNCPVPKETFKPGKRGTHYKYRHLLGGSICRLGVGGGGVPFTILLLGV